jgi:hypothetical protein
MKDNNIESRSLSGFGRRARPIILAGLLLLYGCGGMQPKPTYFPKEGDPNTLTYVENGKRKTVCNLNGKWRGIHNSGERNVFISK